MIGVINDRLVSRCMPVLCRSNNGPEFVAQGVCDRVGVVGAKVESITLGPLWEKGSPESVSARY